MSGDGNKRSKCRANCSADILYERKLFKKKKRKRNVNTVGEDWTKARLKLSRMKTKFFNSISNTSGFILKQLR